MNEIGYRRMGLPFKMVQSAIRGVGIALHPLNYASRKIGKSQFLAGTAPRNRVDPDLGYRPIPIGSLPGTDRIKKICQQLYRDAKPTLESLGGRYGINLLTSDLEVETRGELDLRKFPELLEFAVSDEVLATVVDYLGEIPVLAGVELVVTTPMTENVGNNFYHFDKPSPKQLKFWMAIEDVDAGSGPLTFLPADASKEVRRKTGHVTGRLTDQEVYEAVPESQKIEFLGKAGEGMWVDTCRCVHFGSRTREHNRVLLMLSFFTKFWWAEPGLYFSPTQFDNTQFKNHRVQQQVLELMVNGPTTNRWLSTVGNKAS
jgi:hypothetical protein